MAHSSVRPTALLTPITSHHSNQPARISTVYTPESIFSLTSGIRSRLLHVGERVLGPTHHTSQSNGIPLPLGSIEAVEKIHTLLDGLGVHGYSAKEVENVWIHYARSKGGYQDPLRYPWSPLGGKSDGAMLIGSNGSVDSDVGEFEIGDEDFEDYKIISNLQRAFEDGKYPPPTPTPHIDIFEATITTDTERSQSTEYKDSSPAPKREREREHKRKRPPPPVRLHRKIITPSTSLAPSPDTPAKRTRSSAKEDEEWTEVEYCALIGAIVDAGEISGKHWEVIAEKVKKFSPRGIDRHAEICKKTFTVTEETRFNEFTAEGILYTPEHFRAVNKGPRSWAHEEKKALWEGVIIQGSEKCDWEKVTNVVNSIAGKKKRCMQEGIR